MVEILPVDATPPTPTSGGEGQQTGEMVPPFDPIVFLARYGIADVTGAARATGGNDTEVWRVDRANDAVAVRVFRPKSGARIVGEVAAMLAAHAVVPVPRVVLIGEWHGRYVAVIEWVRGVTLLAALQARPSRVWRLGVTFGAAQAAMHRATPPAVVPAPEVWSSRLVPDVSDGARTAMLRDAATAPRALLHLDYHPMNVLVDDADRVTGVIDWADAAAGPPAADLAWTWVILAAAPSPPGWGAPAMAVMRRVLTVAWRVGYRRAGGAFPSDATIAPYIAWASRRLCGQLAGREGRDSAGARAVRRWALRWERLVAPWRD
jgi:aminoglycoside phosphotransferase (APT) family kinase protein